MMISRKIIALAAVVLISACTMVTAKYSSKLEEQKRTRGGDSGSFIPQGRWGRSEGVGDIRFIKHFLNNNNKVFKLTQRAFQVGSRFGKRGASIASNPQVYPPPKPSSLLSPVCTRNEDLQCAYTGLANIYSLKEEGSVKSAEEEQPPNEIQ